MNEKVTAICALLSIVIVMFGTCVCAVLKYRGSRRAANNHSGAEGNQSKASEAIAAGRAQIESARSDNQRASELLDKAEKILNK